MNTDQDQSTVQINPDWNAMGTPLRHTWAGLLNIDQFRWLVRRDAQKHLAMAAREIGGRHVRAVGMFDDEMKVLTRDPTTFATARVKDVRSNWQVVAYVIDSLLDFGLCPMFTTTFMPSALSAGERTVFTTKSRISPPKDPMKWRELVESGIRFCIDRYGRSRVRSWWFEVWNEPNLTNGFFEGTQPEFFELWKHTYDAIKNVDAELLVGGPSSARGEWVADMIEFGRKRECEPDFIVTHVYNNDSEGQPLSPFDGPQEDRQSKSPHFAAGVMRGVRRLCDQLDYKGQIHWNEWGRSWLPCHPDRETPNEAAFVVKTMSEVSQEADAFAYWCLSDIYDQVGYGREAFHGNYGMVNLQGLRKPAYHAHQLLCTMATTRVPVAVLATTDAHVGAIATNGSTGQSSVLVYRFDTDGQRNDAPTRLQIRLPNGCKEIELLHVDSERNDVVSGWRRLGAPAYLSREQTELLRAENQLRFERRTIKDPLVTLTQRGSGLTFVRSCA